MAKAETIAIQQLDLTGDGISDTITLLGEREEPSSPFLKNITLIITDEATRQPTVINPPENAGYNPRLFFCDFNRDGVPDVLLSIDSGGSGGFVFVYLFTFRNARIRELFSVEEFNREYRFDVIYRNNYRVDVNARNRPGHYTIDVRDRMDIYQEVYGPGGELLNPVYGDVQGLNVLYPLAGDDGCDILVIQRVVGLYSADLLGYMETAFTWQNGRFVQTRQEMRAPDNP